MGATASKVEEDKALQLCRERKKFVRQALDGRCSLAAAHVMYIQSLRSTGTALRKFVEPEAHVEPFLHHSSSATPEPLALMEKSLSQLSFSSPSVSRRHNATDALSPSPPPPPPSSTTYRANCMKVTGSYSKEVSEKVPSPVMGRVVFSGEQRNSEPPSMEPANVASFLDPRIPPEIPVWDFFGLSHPIDNQFSSEEGKGTDQRFERAGDIRRFQEEEGMPELEDALRSVSSLESERYHDSDDEFNEPSTDTLVRRFENVNRVVNNQRPSTPCKSPAETVTASETEFWSGDRGASPDLTSFRGTPSTAAPPADAKRPMRGDQNEKKVAPKDFYSSIKDIEFLFIKASESGKEVPRKLEANKLNFRPILQRQERSSVVCVYLSACISCGQVPQPAQKGTSSLFSCHHHGCRLCIRYLVAPNIMLHNTVSEPAQAADKYLTWHRTTSSRSASSGNLLGLNPEDDVRELNGSYVENSCMISGSHASTLDRLYAWERKLYDEVKDHSNWLAPLNIQASQEIRRDYDLKCKLLRQLESQKSSTSIEKTRAAVKDLHSRIKVAIHRIDSISKKIEELRDRELQPQLEELIKGLSRMWEVMFECHKLQFKIISVAYCNINARIPLQWESHKQIVLQLENELGSLSSSFTKWIGTQKSYLQSINDWLFKGVSLEEMTAKRKKRWQPQPKDKVRRFGPPIYTTCIEWLEMLEKLPEKEVSDSIKGLAVEVHRFLPRQEKSQGKGSDAASRDDASDDCPLSIDRVRSSMVVFLDKLNRYAELSVNEYASLEKTISESKIIYDKLKGG